MDDDLSVVSRTPVFMDLARVNRDEFTRHHGMGRSLHSDICLSVDQIGDLQGGMPVGGNIGLIGAEINGNILIDQVIFWNVNITASHRNPPYFTGMCFFDLILPESEKKSKLNMIPVTHLPIIRGCNIVFLNENVKKD